MILTYIMAHPSDPSTWHISIQVKNTRVTRLEEIRTILIMQSIYFQCQSHKPVCMLQDK